MTTQTGNEPSRDLTAQIAEYSLPEEAIGIFRLLMEGRCGTVDEVGEFLDPRGMQVARGTTRKRISRSGHLAIQGVKEVHKGNWPLEKTDEPTRELWQDFQGLHQGLLPKDLMKVIEGIRLAFGGRKARSGPKDSMGGETQEETCKHYWLIDSPSGPTSKGVCKICGAEDEFPNTLEIRGWERSQP